MLHKLTAAALTTLGLLLPLTSASEAQANPHVRIPVDADHGIRRGPARFPGAPSYYPGRPGHFPGRWSGYYPPVPVNPIPGGHHCHYHVLYRTCQFEPWQVYGTYTSHWRAHRIEAHLQRLGYEARVEHH